MQKLIPSPRTDDINDRDITHRDITHRDITHRDITHRDITHRDITHRVTDSPIGPLTLVAHDGVLAGLYMDDQRHRPDPSRHGRPDRAAFDAAVDQLDDYFAGRRTAFDLPIALAGTDFQRAVWGELQRIPYGQTISYGELARRIGRPGASRAVGLANGRNPIAIIVPCHRVIGAGGRLVGYGGGPVRKQHLLDLEGGRAGTLF
jgi:methylated-DNA-[protein]-cysteine S-methyltransferase